MAVDLSSWLHRDCSVGDCAGYAFDGKHEEAVQRTLKRARSLRDRFLFTLHFVADGPTPSPFKMAEQARRVSPSAKAHADGLALIDRRCSPCQRRSPRSACSRRTRPRLSPR